MKPTDIDIRLTRRNLFGAFGATLALGGCGGFSVIQAPDNPLVLYRLQPQLQRPEAGPHVSWQLAVTRPFAMQSLDTDRVALVRGETMDYYANAQWTDSAPHLIQTLLVDAFEQSGRIPAVGRETDGLHAALVLHTELRDFTAHYDNGDGAPSVVVGIQAKLIDVRGNILDTLAATHTAPAAQNSVVAVVAAFDQATGPVLEQIVDWTLRKGR